MPLSSTWMSLARRSISSFEKLGSLGTGGMGTVYRAFDHQSRHEVALKQLVSVKPEALLSFKREFRLLAEQVHPNVVTLYELFQDGSDWFLVMELVQGARDFLDYVRPYRHLVNEFSPPAEEESTVALREHDPVARTVDIHELNTLV